MITACGEKIRELREKLGLTQRQLAERIGIGKSTLAMYETKDRMPSPVVLIKLASCFHVSTDYLLGIDGVKRVDMSGLTEKDVEYIEGLIELLREKNQK